MEKILQTNHDNEHIKYRIWSCRGKGKHRAKDNEIMFIIIVPISKSRKIMQRVLPLFLSCSPPPPLCFSLSLSFSLTEELTTRCTRSGRGLVRTKTPFDFVRIPRVPAARFSNYGKRDGVAVVHHQEHSMRPSWRAAMLRSM